MGTWSWAAAEDQDFNGERKQFLRARAALLRGERDRFQALAQGLKSYPLYPYLRYEDLRRRFEGASSREIQEFLGAYPDTPPAEKLRTAWLHQLARAGDWPAFLTHYTPQKATILRCHHLTARIRLNRLEWVPQEAKELWLAGKDQPKECDLPFEHLSRSDLMTADLVWERVRLAMTEGSLSLANYLSRRLDPKGRNWVPLWMDVHRDPALALGSPSLKTDEPIVREILSHGIKRLAKKDATQAHALWSGIKPRHAFSEKTIGEVARALALAAVAQKHSMAPAWLDAIPPEAVNAEVQQARLRTAIAASDWPSLKRWTDQEAAPEMNALGWRYWRARALEETGEGKAAPAIYRSLAQEPDYYGFLAADRIGLPYSLRPVPIQASSAQEAAIRSQPGLVRARELYLAGLRPEARGEWMRLIEILDQSQLPVAAAIAHRWGWHDRAILTLGKARALSDLEIRFPVPHRGLVQRYAQERGLDLALLYGFIRAESAFWEDARSPAGALGLMQLMPATGRETARRLGVGLSSPLELLEAEKNVRLGSAYLRDMLLRFDGHVAMAAAAYNAGPGRAEAWRPPRDCQPADRWVELIPFTETRRYVQNILFYTGIYEWRLGRQVQPLTARLAAIAPKAASAGKTQWSCVSTLPTRYRASYQG
jgi:soluble lytic murein transglycosylase